MFSRPESTVLANSWTFPVYVQTETINGMREVSLYLLGCTDQCMMQSHQGLLHYNPEDCSSVIVIGQNTEQHVDQLVQETSFCLGTFCIHLQDLV